jgi:hypothetical protein
MNIQETAAVLAKIKIGDNREVDSKGLVLREWHESIGDLDFADAIAAVAMHRKGSKEYIQAFHVRDNARVIRARRARAQRVNSPRAIAPTVITLDREKFERETQAAIEAARAAKVVTS